MCLHKFVKLVTSSVPVSKFYIQQMIVSVRMQFHNYVATQPVKCFERAMQNIYEIKFGTLQVHENEIFTAQMLQWFCGFAHLRGNIGHQGRWAIW